MSTNLVSIVLVLVMMLTGVCGSFGSAGVTEPVSVELDVGVDGDLSSLIPDQNKENVAVIQQILNAFSLRVAVDASAAQLETRINGKPVSSMSVKSGEEAWEAVSDLFPGYLLTIQNSTIDSLMEEMAGSASSYTSEIDTSSVQEIMDKVDPEALANAVNTVSAELQGSFESRFGEAETGVFVVGDREYTAKSTCDITMKEAIELVIPAMKKLLSDESFAPILSLFGEDFSLEDLDEALEDIRDTDEADLPVLSVAKYSAENGDTCTDILMEKDQQTIRFAAASAGETTVYSSELLMDESDRMILSLSINEAAREVILDADLTVSGQSMLLHGVLVAGEETGSLSFSFTMPVSGSPLTIRISGTYTREAPVFAAGEDLETVSLEDMVKDEASFSRFNSKVMIGLMQLLSKVAADYPDVTKLLTPSSSDGPSEVEKVPAEEETVVVEETPAEETPAEEAPAENVPVEVPVEEGSAA